MNRLLILVFLALTIIKSNAQKTRQGEINQTATHLLNSKITGTQYHLSVSLPQHYSATDTTKYPVLFLLDGGLGFPIANAANGALGLFGSFTKVIIVGIEYEWEKSLSPWFLGRTRDYTPTRDTSFDNLPAYNDAFGLPPGSIVSGGADKFLEVFRKELIPFIERQYKTNGDRGLSGHSFGGLFTVYSLFKARDLFNRFGVNSPSLWWDKKFMFSLEEQYFEKNKSLPAKVFMSVGGDEGPMMTPAMTEFANKLKSRKYNGLQLSSFVFEGENHMSVVPAMISRTLRELYEVKKK